MSSAHTQEVDGRGSRGSDATELEVISQFLYITLLFPIAFAIRTDRHRRQHK